MRSFAIALVCLFVGTSIVSAQTNLYVGSNSSFVTNNFTEGSAVFDRMFVGYGPDASNNSVNVMNVGAELITTNSAWVGFGSSGNQLNVLAGASFTSPHLEIGFSIYDAPSRNASNNTLFISGAGSVANIRYSIQLGRESTNTGNTLLINDGGGVTCGAFGGGNGSSVVVSGVGSYLSTSNEFSSGADEMYFSDGSSVSTGALSVSRLLSVTGSNTTLECGYGLKVSGASAGAVAFVSRGAKVTMSSQDPNSSSSIGNYSANNRLVLTDSGSSIISSNSFFRIGYRSSSNSVVVSNAATLSALNLFIGECFQEPQSGNSLIVTGVGSLVRCADLYIGYKFEAGSSNNSVSVLNGGRIEVLPHSLNQSIASISTSYAGPNYVTVDGTNSSISTQRFYLQGDRSVLTLANGGTLDCSTWLWMFPLTALDIGSYDRTDSGGEINAPRIWSQDPQPAEINFNQTNHCQLSADIDGFFNVNQRGTGTTTLNGSNAFIGGVIISSGQLILGHPGRIQFVVGPNGSSNQITGTGSFTANGTFGFDLAQAPKRTGDSSQIVSVGSASYGTNFSVDGFTNTGQGTWDRLTNKTHYRFDQATGALSVVSGSTNIPYNRWVTNFPTIPNLSASADPDGDGYSNQQEFVFNGSPVDPTPSMLRIESSGPNAKISFMGRRNPSEAAYYVMSTTNLSSGTWQTNTSVSLVESADQSGVVFPDTYVRREFAVPASGRNFFRIKAEVPQ